MNWLSYSRDHLQQALHPKPWRSSETRKHTRRHWPQFPTNAAALQTDTPFLLELARTAAPGTFLLDSPEYFKTFLWLSFFRKFWSAARPRLRLMGFLLGQPLSENRIPRRQALLESAGRRRSLGKYPLGRANRGSHGSGKRAAHEMEIAATCNRACSRHHLSPPWNMRASDSGAPSRRRLHDFLDLGSARGLCLPIFPVKGIAGALLIMQPASQSAQPFGGPRRSAQAAEIRQPAFLREFSRRSLRHRVFAMYGRHHTQTPPTPTAGIILRWCFVETAPSLARQPRPSSAVFSLGMKRANASWLQVMFW